MALEKTGHEEREDFRARVVAQIAEMGIKTTPCRSCGEPIFFLKTNADKWQVVDMYLESHFANCSNPGAHRR